MSEVLHRLVALARTRIGQKYVLGARAPMANPDWSGPWDCAEFVSWCVYQVTGRLYGTRPRGNPVLADAYTGYWWEQSLEDGAQVQIGMALAINGAILLRRPAGRVNGHIAFSDGQGGTVEAHSARLGVIAGTATGRPWDVGVLLPWIDTPLPRTEQPYQPPAVRLRVEHPLIRGKHIAELQQQLLDAGFDPGRVDGVYGPQTAHAVMRFQTARGLVADGEVGSETLRALEEEAVRA